MVLLQVISDREPPRRVLVQKFPFRVGRSERNDLRLQDPGVWAEHLVLEVDLAAGEVRAAASTEAVTLLNGERVSSACLRSGDLIQLGSSRIGFSLSPPPQKPLAKAEFFAWALVAGAALVQFFLLLRLSAG